MDPQPRVWFKQTSSVRQTDRRMLPNLFASLELTSTHLYKFPECSQYTVHTENESTGEFWGCVFQKNIPQSKWYRKSCHLLIQPSPLHCSENIINYEINVWIPVTCTHYMSRLKADRPRLR